MRMAAAKGEPRENEPRKVRSKHLIFSFSAKTYTRSGLTGSRRKGRESKPAMPRDEFPSSSMDAKGGASSRIGESGSARESRSEKEVLILVEYPTHSFTHSIVNYLFKRFER